MATSSRRARAAALTRDMRAQGRSWAQIAERIAKQEKVSRLAAIRLAHGMKQRDTAHAWNTLWPSENGSGGISDKLVSLWEIWPLGGREPSLRSLKRLAQIYHCNVGDLVIDGDFTHLDDMAAHTRTATAVALRDAVPAYIPHSVPGAGDSAGFYGPADEDDGDDMRRRAFVTGLAAMTSLGAANPRLALESMRHEMTTLLSERHTATTIDEWQAIADEYGRTYLTTTPADLLQTLIIDLSGLQTAVGRYPDGPVHQELRRVGALLSLHMAATLGNLGYLSDAQRWWRSAKRAADESGDDYTILFVRGQEMRRAISEQRPAAELVRLAAEADARLGTKPPLAALPAYLDGKACALATAGGGAAAGAEDPLRRLPEAVSALPASLTASGSVSSFSEGEVWEAESYVYTYMGDLSRAGAAQDRALALYPVDDHRERAQIELQRSLCLVGTGDVLTGVRHAHGVVSNLPSKDRIRPVAALGSKILKAVPTGQREQPGVQEFQVCLSEAFPAPPAPQLAL